METWIYRLNFNQLIQGQELVIHLGSLDMDYNILKIFKYTYSSQWKRKKALYGVLYLTLWMILSGCSSATSGEDPASAEYWLKSQLVETVTSISKIPTKIEYYGAPYNLLKGEKNQPPHS